MNSDSINQGILTSKSSSPGAVTRGMQRARAIELALSNGHAANEVSKSDWEQAKRELKGETEKDPTAAILEAAPETERWDPVPGSVPQQIPDLLPEGEDEEGLTEIDQLVEQGVEVAESDQALQAARAANKQEQKTT